MSSTYTDLLRLVKPTTGELDATWGDVVNAGLTALIDTAIAGTANIAHDDSANYTLTTASGAADEARAMFLNITGALGAARNVVCPTSSKLYFAHNATTGGFAVTLKTTAGTGIAIPSGKYMMLYCDGTNVVEAVNYSTALTPPSAANPTGTIAGAAVNGSAATFMRSDAVPALSATVNPVGLQTCSMPAGAMKARTTNGAAPGTVETATNKAMLLSFDFDAATQEYVQFGIWMPKSWNESTLTFAAEWSHAATTTNFGVAWSLAAVAVGNGDAFDAARGTAILVTDTGGTTDYSYSSAVSAAMTVAGSPTANEWVIFEVSRVVSDAGDTMAIDARLHGVQLYYTTDAATDA